MLNIKRKAAYKKGVEAEKVAAQYLEQKGFRILQHRYKAKGGEIDLVAWNDGTLVFVEVKAHRDQAQSLYAVTAKSRRRIEQAALYFVSEYSEYAQCAMRFDVITVPETLLRASDRAAAHNLLGDNGLQHLDNAWLAGQ